MNRIHSVPSSTFGTLRKSSQRPDATAVDHDERWKQSLFVPLHYEKEYAYPLLVWLHGAGDDERQLKRVMPGISLRNYIAVGPRGTSPYFTDEAASYCWQQTESDIIEAQYRLAECIERVQARYNVHSSRVFVGGYADGGTMALRLALRMPQLCAGVISIGGAMPQGLSPLVNVERARGLPVLLMQGKNSQEYPTDQMCHDLRVLHAAGMAAAIRQYPAEDELTTTMLSDLNAWLMERVTGVPSESPKPVGNRREHN